MRISRKLRCGTAVGPVFGTATIRGNTRWIDVMCGNTHSAAQPAAVYLLPPDRVVKGASPHAEACFEQLKSGFAIQSTTAHMLVSDPSSAEMILAPIQGGAYGPCFEALRRSRWFHDYAPKLLVYSPDDNQFPAIRGLYPAAPRNWVGRGWALPAHYISAHIHKFAFSHDELLNKDILFSFVGSSRTHPVRERIVRWEHPRAVVIDSSPKSDKLYWWQKSNKGQFFDTFRDVVRRSRFVICPRGISPSSIRLYEAMEAQAVPIIIADDLELPLGPAWEKFSLRVRERDVDTIPALVERAQDRATEMGSAARRAWERYFSERATVASVVGWAKILLTRPYHRPVMLRLEEHATRRLWKAKLRRAFR